MTLDDKRLRACAPDTELLFRAGDVLALVEERDGLRREYEARGERIADREDRVDSLSDELQLLRHAAHLVLKSAVPHPVEHPSMHRAWGVLRSALVGLPAPSLSVPCFLDGDGAVVPGGHPHNTYRRSGEECCAACGARRTLGRAPR